MRTSLRVVVGLLFVLAPLVASAQSVDVSEDGQVRIKSGDEEVVIGPDSIKAREGGEEVTITPEGIRARDASGQAVKVTGEGITAQAGPGEGEVVCAANQTLKLTGRTIEAKGIAIAASGNCTLTIFDSKVSSAGPVAIAASGNATIRIVNSRVAAGRTAVELSGNADVEASGSKFVGKVVTRSVSCDFEDEGGNKFLDPQ